ncbi:site-specific integrase [Mesorhizobium sp. M2D.F.Ca.ET.225.01.1.1]|uniref:tyrosine-type recombinase/integrase n=1 Tax=unclassified Mesorhizobium TaxID=325217 RepID=UPI000FD432A3|nr:MULTISPECIES: site-specific integrase [unclassified Mesorhizobium]TGP65430.1 site-specific integrase [Mesorhizobium sp. M2D.F.Ca.ET.226.01.1.1]TGP71909.1 site-specific integrase [Mesorhizobium sp. M2D.F.Ca.ET.225.01.1.1]
MARNKLSESKLKGLTDPGLYGDGDGLWIRVQKGGSKNWLFIYRRGVKREELGLGGYGRGTAPVSLALAREKAETIRQQLARGEDPRAARTHKPKTFIQVANALIDAKRPEWTGGKTAREWEVSLREQATHLHNMPVGEIVLGDVKECLLALWTTQPETASRLRARVESVFDYASAHGWRTAGNPARWTGLLDKVLPRPAASGKHHAALPYKQIPALMKALREANTAAARVVELIALTAVRAGEARGAVWDEFDLAERTWTIPKARMKAKRDHVIPLSERAMTILQTQKQVATNQFVFASRKAETHISEMIVVKAMREASPGKAATLHGLRSSFRDWCGDCTDHPREVAEAALAHVIKDKTEAAYRRGTALDKRREMMTDWAEYCAKAQ